MKIQYPPSVETNPGYWFDPRNLWRSRRKFSRIDNSNEWRHEFFQAGEHPPDRSVPWSTVVPGAQEQDRLRIFVVGDTGEGDRSQWATLPLIRALDPDLMLINGDVAYPSGEMKDFEQGFFAPYAGLNIPIWAVPGNHEYYARQKGKTFYEIFCTTKHRQAWSEARLKMVPQPGTYWELRDPDPDGSPLVILGLDSGMKGNLDGEGWFHEEDEKQHDWLRRRLQLAERDGKSVVVLFHIPVLVGGRRKKVHLRKVHRILAGSPAVRLVICGHVHNHQHYAAETWREFLGSLGVPRNEEHEPFYLVSGGGGAYLSSPPKKEGPHPAEGYFPSREDWNDHSGRAERVIRTLRFGRAAIGRIASIFSSRGRADADTGKYSSGVLIDVLGSGPDATVEARQILLDDVRDLFDPENTSEVAVDDPDPPFRQGAVEELLARRETMGIR